MRKHERQQNPATKAIVVIKIGRRRLRSASMMASKRGSPAVRTVWDWSICKMEFFCTTPNSTSSPSIENISSWMPNKITAINANGTVSGRQISSGQGAHPRLKLRGEHEVHEDKGEEKGEGECGAYFRRPTRAAKGLAPSRVAVFALRQSYPAPP